MTVTYSQVPSQSQGIGTIPVTADTYRTEEVSGEGDRTKGGAEAIDHDVSSVPEPDHLGAGVPDDDDTREDVGALRREVLEVAEAATRGDEIAAVSAMVTAAETAALREATLPAMRAQLAANMSKLTECFRLLDVDNDGRVTRSEFRTALPFLGLGAGGRGGIGRAVAEALARDGISLALTDIERAPDTLPPDEVAAGWRGIESVAEELRVAGVDAETFVCDLTDPDAIERLVKDVAERFGRIDILVNNARALMGRDAEPVTDLPLEVWRTFLDVNTTAPFLLIRHAARHMIERGRGGRRGG